MESLPLLDRAVRASGDRLRDALRYRHAGEPRWVRPLGLAMDLLMGSSFGLLFFLFFVELGAFVAYADGSAAWWRYVVAAAVAFVLLIAARIFTAQARDAWRELRAWHRGRRTRQVKLLPARTSPGRP